MTAHHTQPDAAAPELGAPAAVRPAAAADLPALAKVLSEAFAEYPWTRWSIPTEDYEQRLEHLQELYLGHALAHGLVFTDDARTSVAAFLPPDAPELPGELQEVVGELHGDRLSRLLELSLPQGPAEAWSLATVGVSPASQGRGLGSAVTRAGLAAIDERHAPVSLETSSEDNVRLYLRLGFAVDATTQVPDGPIVYSMSRPARPQAD